MMNDKMHPIGKWQTDFGFTLIEMIGVLAVIAIFVALLLPKVFEIMAESKTNAVVAAVALYKTAIVKYYADIGSVLPLDANGEPAVETTGDSANPLSLPARLVLDASDPLNTGVNGWANFNGPYLTKFSTNAPPGFGSSMRMRATNPAAYGTVVAAGDRGWDFDDDGNNDIPTNANVVFWRVHDVERADFERVDAVLDQGIGATFGERRVRGKVKYVTADKRLKIYLTHK
ncbi:MAG: hypothetical protein NPIRA02_19030 [Nitrospirales bacterium]|nr:MAG: hypothetical protein NPIRA02_19030 [Nitrospirales bacterium]